MLVLRSISIMAVLSVPALAGATSGPGSGEGGAGSGEGGDVGSGEGTASPPETSGEPTTGATTDDTGGHTETDGSDSEESDKGCSIGGHQTAPGVLALALLGLHGLRRRRA